MLLGGAVVFKTGVALKPIRYSIITLQNHGEYCVGFIDNKLSACYSQFSLKCKAGTACRGENNSFSLVFLSNFNLIFFVSLISVRLRRKSSELVHSCLWGFR